MGSVPDGFRSLVVYPAFALQATAQSISWQFITYFVNHELQVESFLMMAVIWSLPAFVTMVATSFWGIISDRTGARKPFMVMGFLVYAETFLFYSMVSTGLQYFLIAMIGAAVAPAAIPAGQAYVTRGITQRGARIGYLLVAQSVGWSVGALFSGLLYDLIGMFALYRASAALSLLAAITVLTLAETRHVQPSIPRRHIGVPPILHQRGIWTLLLAVGLSALGNNAVSFVLAIIIVDELGGSTVYVGYANAAATLLAATLAGFIGRLADRKGAANVLVAAYASYSMYAIAFALAGDAMSATLLYALPLYPMASTGAYALAATLSDDSKRGSAMGLVNGMMNAGAALGPMMGGYLAETVFGRAQPISWLNALCNAMALVLALLLVRSTRTVRVRLTAESDSGVETDRDIHQ
ncbi:MAG: MFS transporter [Candidatus Thorarchaeota archaeon]